MGYLIFVIALHPLYLNSNDNIDQGPGKHSPKPIYLQSTIYQIAQGTHIQRTSFDESQSHCIDGGTTVQKSSTVLIIDLNPGYVFRPTPICEWVWVQERS